MSGGLRYICPSALANSQMFHFSVCIEQKRYTYCLQLDGTFFNCTRKSKIIMSRRRRLKDIHSRSNTNRTRLEALSFYYPRLMYCLNQMLAVMLLSQYRVSSSKTIRPRAVRTWSAVCSDAPHSQFGEETRPHLCMHKWNRPTPIRRRLSLTQAARGKPISTGLAPVTGTKTRSLEAFSQYSVFHL